MPPSSNNSSRRSGAKAPPASAPRAAKPRSGSTSRLDERTVDLSAPRRASAAPKKPIATDPGAKRRALKKKRGRQRDFAAWLIAGAVSVMIAGAAAGVWSEFQGAQGRVGEKRATLAVLTRELEIGKKRLRALASASGKERVLVENGFIKPGERLLLFPKETAKKE